MPTALLVVGTRPEAIKLAPVEQALREHGLVRPAVVTTGQHGDVVYDVLDLFSMIPWRALRLARDPEGGLPRLYADLLVGLDRAMADLRPDVVVVQGDTATVLAGAQTAFLRRLPVVHVEAGLRSGSLGAPFPEEANRRMVAAIATLHLAPTRAAERNLLVEGHSPLDIILTGNTVVDALATAARSTTALGEARLERAAARAAADGSRTVVVVTAHRRESWGAGMRGIAAAVARLAAIHQDLTFATVTHMNPDVRATFEGALGGIANVVLTGPLGYGQFARLLGSAALVLTDSGGVQEEAPALGVPVLVLRDRTERTEGVDAGAASLVGTDPGRIVAVADHLLSDRPGAGALLAAGPCRLYGDGEAGRRSAEAVEWLLGRRSRPEPFRPASDAMALPA